MEKRSRGKALTGRERPGELRNRGSRAGSSGTGAAGRGAGRKPRTGDRRAGVKAGLR
jgi:hypothetical protein